MSGSRQLWIIDPSVRCPEDQGVEEIRRDWDGPSRVFRPCLGPDRGPETGAYEAAAVVVMGSARSVHDPDDWIGKLGSWLRPVIDGDLDLPVLGICFGHQLIAHLAGGDVGFVHEDRSKVLGVRTSRLSGGRLLPGAHELRVVASHRERVESLPAGYRAVAWQATSPIDGLEHERRSIYSYQFHPEARDEFARSSGIEPSAIDADVRRDGQRVIAAFLRTCR